MSSPRNCLELEDTLFLPIIFNIQLVQGNFSCNSADQYWCETLLIVRYSAFVVYRYGDTCCYQVVPASVYVEPFSSTGLYLIQTIYRSTRIKNIKSIFILSFLAAWV